MLLPISKSPEYWDETDLRILCEDRIPESQRLDYKRELNLDPPKERRELLKDITALANSNGGIIIYGIKEEKHPDLGSIASELTPMIQADLIDRATRIIRSGIAPGLQFYLYKIEARQGGYYLIAYVPESHLKPHAVISEKRIYYYARRNQDNLPLTEPEIRQMYANSAYNNTSLRQRYLDLEKIHFFPSPKGYLTLTCMPINENLALANTLHIHRDQLNSSHYNSWFSGNILRPLVDRFEGTNPGMNISYGVRIYQNGDITYGTGIHALPAELFQLKWLVEDWLRALRFFLETYSTLRYWGAIRLWFEIDVKETSFDWTTNCSDKLNFDRNKILFWIDGKVDDLSTPRSLCIPLVRYFLQACRQDWSQEDTERWFNEKITNGN